MKYKRSDGICLVCSKANTNSDAIFSTFGCDGEQFALCGNNVSELCVNLIL